MATCSKCRYYRNHDGRHPEDGYCALYNKSTDGDDEACNSGSRSGYMSDFDDSRF